MFSLSNPRKFSASKITRYTVYYSVCADIHTDIYLTSLYRTYHVAKVIVGIWVLASVLDSSDVTHLCFLYSEHNLT